MKKYIFILLLSIFYGFLGTVDTSYAKTDLSISDTDITFSETSPMDGDSIKIYARVFNFGDDDVSGSVIFLNNGKEMSEPQIISLKPNTYDDVFIELKVKAGTYNISAKITNLSLTDENLSNNETKKDFFVDSDTDEDGIGDSKDEDKDNDGVSNEDEAENGTNPLSPDTDGDTINDDIDDFPLDKTEWRDTDQDGIGDNKDEDADGDGILNLHEIQKYDTNYLSYDTDNDGINDGREINLGTNPNKEDTDNDGVIDSKDEFPLDASMASASLIDSVKNFINDKPEYLIFGLPVVLFILLLMFRKKK